MYSLTIVIPAFNEERRLDSTLNKLDAFLKAEDWNAEIIVVDDGSTDGTARLVTREMQQKPYLRLLQNHINRGKGFSLRRGVEAALGEIRRALPDLLLLDWMLPGQSGLALARGLRGETRTRELPIIMVTARGDEADRVAGLEAWVDDYVTKPFSPRELKARIKEIGRAHV